MYRRRRPHREIEFSFDSFLDLVANVVGIILRLILIAWVAGRGYQYVVPPPAPLPEMSQPEELPEPTIEQPPAFARTREEIERERAEERAKIVEVATIRERERAEEGRIAEAAEARSRLAAQEAALAKAGVGVSARLKATKLTTAELEARSKKLLADLEAVRKLPPKRKELRYHTPVAAEVQTEEVMFECRAGRVTLLDTAALVAKAREGSRNRVKELEAAWEFSATTPPVGSFRLRYVVERERTPLDGFGSAPVGSSFRYGMTSWEAVPTNPERGEGLEKALAVGSVFRRITDAIDPKETVVTLWVYPDSFPLYRKLRDHLHDREIVVAGRPLPEGSPIASSRHGTTSRGQ